jgi:hypothetical protein
MNRLKKGYEVRAFQPGDEEEIVKLLKLVFDGWPNFDLICSPLEHWRWKYQDNPLGMNRIAVGVSNNIMIGCDHSLPLRIKIGNRVYLSTQGVDTAVHSDFRGMAIFNKMMDLVIKMRKETGVQLHYFLTWNLILRKSLPKLYREFPHIVMRLYRIHDVNLQLRKQPIKNALIYKYGFHLVKLANRCRNSLRLHTPSSYDFHIRKITHFDERIEMFWKEIKDHYNFIVERSQGYLNWRYIDSRGGDYLVKIAEANGKILGYMVLRINKRQIDYPIGYFVDLLTLPNRLDVTNALVEDAVNYFDGNNINIIICLIIKNHPYKAILKRHGFITRRERIPLSYREYAEIEELRKLETGSPSSIHFAYGDLDVI